MAERKVGTYREGDLIRVTHTKTGEGFQARARKHGHTLFLDRHWSTDWHEWTFLDWWGGQEEYTVELLERGPDPLPTEPGYYVVHMNKNGDDEQVWQLGNGDWYQINRHPDKYEKPEGFLKIERLLTKGEVMRVTRGVARVGVEWDQYMVEKLEASL